MQPCTDLIGAQACFRFKNVSLQCFGKEQVITPEWTTSGLTRRGTDFVESFLSSGIATVEYFPRADVFAYVAQRDTRSISTYVRTR